MAGAGLSRRLKAGAGLSVLAAALCGTHLAAQERPLQEQAPTPVQSTSKQQQPAPSASRTALLSLPLVRNSSPLGEILVMVGTDGAPQFELETLAAVLAPLLSEPAVEKLVGTAGGAEYVSADQLKAAGFDLRFDISSLEVVIDSLDPTLLKIVELGNSREANLFRPTVDPAGFSMYTTFAGNFEYAEGEFSDGLRNPDILAFGGVRAGRFALEYEGGLAERGPEGYGLYRRFVRGLYEIEEKSLRFTAGDLQVDTLPILGSQLLGGIGVERRKRIFSPFDPVFELGGRRILVSSPSTIEIVSNGQTIRTIPVDEGVYDLQQLPLISGANNLDIVVRDAAGRTSVTNFNYFYDPVELEVGDFEFGAQLGLISNFDSLEPDYRNDPAFSAFFRRAFSASLLLGGAVQASEDAQAVAAEVRWVPQILPGVIESQFSISNGTQGMGVAARVGYRWSRSLTNGGQQFSVLADFESAGFEPVGRPAFLRERRVSLTANYGQNITQDSYIAVGLNYFKRGDTPARITTFADYIHQFTPRLRGNIGAEYGRNDGFEDSIGVRASLTLLIGRTSRATGAYESRRELYRAAVSKGLENRVGAIGYDASFQSSEGRSLADASLRYRGNRFDGRLLVSGSGDGFGRITDDRRAQLQLSSSLAYADGAFGIGSPITDGFAILTPHEAIDGDVVVGNRLNGGEYQAKSGLLGGAIVPNLIGYQTRELLYDLEGEGGVYNVGNGADRVRVPSRGGAKIVVGDFRFVSAVGTISSGGKPIAFASGKVSSETDEGFTNAQFFTNYSGRFSVIGLAPGEQYDITLNDGRKFKIEIPEGTESLLRLPEIMIEETQE